MIEPLAGILGSIVGFGGAAINNYFELRKQREQNQHDKEMAAITSDIKLREYEVAAQDDEHKRLVEHDTKTEGLRALVRPCLTFALVGIALILGFFGVTGWIDGFDSPAFMNWLFASASTIITFYFGSRSFEKADRARFVERR